MKTLQWSLSQKIAFRFIFCFALLFIITLPFPYTFLPNIGAYAQPYSEALIKWFGDEILQIQEPYTHQLISDSTGMYIHTLLLLIIGGMISIFWSIADRKRDRYIVLSYWFRVLISYYLAFQLLKYGFNKIFKLQFYLPEPNMLFTNIGDASRDILYWSVMGVSRSYSIFMGVLEVVPAILLFFRRTRLLGALIAMGVLANVVMVNVSFDISVKIFSTFLLLLSLLIAVPELPNLYRFFTQKPISENNLWRPIFSNIRQVTTYALGKSLIIALLFLDVLLPYFQANNFNDDLVKRPFLHGAYEVEHFQINQDTLPPMLTDARRWKRFFVHRQGYFIVEMMDEQMQDFPLEVMSTSKKLKLTDSNNTSLAFQYHYLPLDNLLILKGILGKNTLQLEARQIDLEALPLLDKSTNWRMDDYFSEE